MTPDINAGAWYLRGRHYAGDVCEPTTGEVFAEVAVDPQTRYLTTRGDAEAGAAGIGAVRRLLDQLLPELGQ